MNRNRFFLAAVTAGALFVVCGCTSGSDVGETVSAPPRPKTGGMGSAPPPPTGAQSATAGK